MEQLKKYLRLPRHILDVILGEFFVQLINAAFTLILLIYMDKEGYEDHVSAGFVSYRFIGVLALAFPLGLWIKGRNLKPFFLSAVISIPFVAILVILAVEMHITWLLYVSQVAWGISFLLMQIPVIPYILRNSPVEYQSEAIALSYATFSISTILCGIIIYILNNIDPVFFAERNLLIIISMLGLAGIYFIAKVNIVENRGENKRNLDFREFDWKIISVALIPTLTIAVGAGLTIPFISLFFYNVHGLDSDQFSIVAAGSSLLVAIAALLVPGIKNRMGYQWAITASQTIAVFALFMMAATEWYSDYQYAAMIAIMFYMIRQPFMNMAGPMTSELVLNYVGKRNREIVSALTSAIWSGSWFISSRIFKSLRESEFSYSSIFIVTVIIYSFGVIWYYMLIMDYYRKHRLGLID